MKKHAMLPVFIYLLCCLLWFCALMGCAGSDPAVSEQGEQAFAGQNENGESGLPDGETALMSEESEEEFAEESEEEPEGVSEYDEENDGASEYDEENKGASEPDEENKEDEETMKMKVTDGKHTVVFELNGSNAAKSLYDQLPLTIEVENYSNDEKIFYPEKLDTTDPVDADAKKGTLAYFSPWGDVVMYYRDFGSYRGLYELGHAISGADQIESLSGTLQITKE